MGNNQIRIALIGDVALNGLFTIEPEKNGNRFSQVAPYLKDCDFVFANLETPLWGDGETNENEIHKGNILYSIEPVFKQVLPLLNVSAVSLANNHIYDCKERGLSNTISCLEKMGINYTGAGFDKFQTDPIVLVKNNKKVAFLAYVHRSTNPRIHEQNGIFVNYFDEETIFRHIEDLVKFCDFVILSLHWGVDYSSYPTRFQRHTAAAFIDAGANIVMGHHTHTLQPIETYGKGVIFYSLGSLCFGDFTHQTGLRALKRKTKHSIIPVLDSSGRILKIACTKELKGNQIVISNRPCRRILGMNLVLTKLKHRSGLVNFILNFKEAFWDRIVEALFGYYRNPLRDIFKIVKQKKILLIFRDYRRLRDSSKHDEPPALKKLNIFK